MSLFHAFIFIVSLLLLHIWLPWSTQHKADVLLFGGFFYWCLPGCDHVWLEMLSTTQPKGPGECSFLRWLAQRKSRCEFIRQMLARNFVLNKCDFRRLKTLLVREEKLCGGNRKKGSSYCLSIPLPGFFFGLCPKYVEHLEKKKGKGNNGILSPFFAWQKPLASHWPSIWRYYDNVFDFCSSRRAWNGALPRESFHLVRFRFKSTQ